MTVQRVDHPPAHRDRHRQDLVGESDLPEGVNAAGGDGEVDGPPAIPRPLPGVRPPLDHQDLVPGTAQVDRHQSPTEAGAEHREPLLRRAQASAPARIRVKRQTSWKVL